MSVLIKDMKKPKFCYEQIDKKYGYEYCPFVNDDSDCMLLLKNNIRGETWEDQYSKCPLVEVPEPHGRLIEAPDVSECEVFDEDTGTREISLLGLMECYRMVKDAETVIEAEGE